MKQWPFLKNEKTTFLAADFEKCKKEKIMDSLNLSNMANLKLAF